MKGMAEGQSGLYQILNALQMMKPLDHPETLLRRPLKDHLLYHSLHQN